MLMGSFVVWLVYGDGVSQSSPRRFMGHVLSHTSSHLEMQGDQVLRIIGSCSVFDFGLFETTHNFSFTAS